MASWLPAPILALVIVASSATVARLGADPLPDAPAPTDAGDDLAAPLFALRRLPAVIYTDPIAAAQRQARTDALAAFVATQPPDTCLVVDDDEGRLLEHRGDDPQTPASAQKIVVGAAALLTLGPESTLGTELYRTGEIVDGVLVGDLHIVGGGDPLVSTADYAARFRSQPQTFTDLAGLAAIVAEAGITRIEGRIVGDESRYDTVRYHEAWPPRFQTQNQTGPLSALHVNDGFTSFPAEGRLPVTPAASPAANAAALTRAVLVGAGIEVTGPGVAEPLPFGAVPVGVLTSAPVDEIVGQALRDSDNNTAELLLKELGHVASGEGTSAAGAAAAAATLAAAGLPHGFVVDGSGLADTNTVTCNGLAAILDHDPIEAELEAGMAVAGRSGTLLDRWVGTDLVGRVRAKTGTLNQVTALAGYATDIAGVTRRFALVVNIEAPALIQRETVAAQQTLAELLVTPDPDIDPAPFGLPAP